MKKMILREGGAPKPNHRNRKKNINKTEPGKTKQWNNKNIPGETRTHKLSRTNKTSLRQALFAPLFQTTWGRKEKKKQRSSRTVADLLCENKSCYALPVDTCWFAQCIDYLRMSTRGASSLKLTCTKIVRRGQGFQNVHISFVFFFLTPLLNFIPAPGRVKRADLLDLIVLNSFTAARARPVNVASWRDFRKCRCYSLVLFLQADFLLLVWFAGCWFALQPTL